MTSVATKTSEAVASESEKKREMLRSGNEEMEGDESYCDGHGRDQAGCSDNNESSIITLPYNTATGTEIINAAPGWGARHNLGVLLFLGFFLAILVRVSLSIAIVAMVGTKPSSNNTQNLTDVCPVPDTDGENSYVEGDFDWNEQTQGIVLGAFYYGYTAGNFLGGRAAEYVGAHVMFGVAVVVPAALSLLSPICASVSKNLFIVLRVLEGLTQAALFPSCHSLLPAWIPPKDRGTFVAIVFSGTILGSIVSMAVGGLLSSTPMGWPSVFYVFGGLGIIWGLPWYFLAHNLPEHHPGISQTELAYIMQHRTYVKQEKRLPLPVREIATSIPFWTLILMNIGYNYGNYNLNTELPTYFSNIQHFDLGSNGLRSALPYVCQWVATVGWGAMVSLVMDRNLVSINVSRKVSTGFGMYVSAAALISMVWVDCNSTAAMVVMCVAVGALGTINSGLALAEQDIAPNFAGSLKGITNTIGGANGFIAPAVTGAIINNNQTLSAWRTVFLVAAALSIFCTTQFLILSTDKVQSWNEPKRKDQQH